MMNNTYIQWQHCFPINEQNLHDLESFDCGCNPTISYDTKIVVHNRMRYRTKIRTITIKGDTSI